MKYSNPPLFVEEARAIAGAPSTSSRVRETADAPADVIARIREGMPIAEFRALADWLEVSDERLAALLGISRATLHRRRKAGILEPPESERIVRFARLMERAVSTLGSESAAREWLDSSAPGLGGETPLSFADTEVGAREVEYLLGRLEHGVFS